MSSQPSKRWVPLLEYAVQSGLSLSTLRRYIKAGKVEFRIEQGRYLIASPDPSVAIPPSTDGSDSVVEELQHRLNKAREEIAELKTLIAVYESQ